MGLSQAQAACGDAAQCLNGARKIPFTGPCLLVGWYHFKPLTILKKYSSLELPIDSYCERICAVIGRYLQNRDIFAH